MANTNHSLIEPQAIREFRELREETIALAKGALPQHLDLMPDGFNNSIRWNLGHLLAAWDHGIFPKLGRERRIPAVYHHMFPRGTSPLDWREYPPTREGIIQELGNQMNDIARELPSQLDAPLAEPFLDMSTMREMAAFLLREEQHHQKVIRAIGEALSSGVPSKPTPAVPAVIAMPDIAVTGIALHGVLRELEEAGLGRKAYQDMQSRREDIPGRQSEDIYLVQLYPPNFNPEADPVTQLIGYLVGPSSAVPDGLSQQAMEAGEYAKYTHKGLESELGRSYGLLYGHWMAEFGREPRGYDLELWGSRYKPDQLDNEIDMFISLAPNK
ncbi:hypothetical protein D3P09_08880 [Paenibacillus pinisoli]|uniref:AraC effector-binding domain-containing protein n=1 Tax=Paenibacillus pinisoli TaxID=1276110 RepID=A0A3A6PIM1_9BACL|nr:DinB family protein [Paenibacillus pinisoli]RJX39526.1 hypothetical protein D3P09_08880 [Paenibacillus pinisoli]